MASASSLRALTTLSRCGMPPLAKMYLPTGGIPLLSLRRFGRLMANALPLGALITLSRCGARGEDLSIVGAGKRMTDRVGQRLGNYRLIRLLGRGGFAEVYLGQHVRLNMQAAIKVLHTQLADEDVENFHREAETIAALTHQHIVRLLDFDVKDGVPFLIMDYAPNGSLRQLHPKGMPLPLSTIISYTRQVASALQYAHDKKIIHRDVKPENMLLGRNHEVLLSDFGIAMMTQSSRYQATQETVGTIYYMAPEQIQGKPRLASDQYALGVVMYEWLSGDRPLHGSFTEIAAQR